MSQTYNYWKLMDEVTVAIRKEKNYGGFSGYVVESTNKEAVESAISWAEYTPYDRETREYLPKVDPDVHTFKNEGFTATILDSAGGSSQGGRLSFWSCKVEKDGVEFVIGVNDAILADLIRSSTIIDGVVQEKVMFARRSGQPGLVHEKMKSYKEALADTEKRASIKSAKKTTKWEIGGVYSSITQSDICLGEVWDTMETVQETVNEGYWSQRTVEKLVKRKEPVKVKLWMSARDSTNNENMTEFLKYHLDNEWYWISTGKPPSRAKSGQLDVTDEDLKLIDEILSKRSEYTGYNGPKITGRYVRELK